MAGIKPRISAEAQAISFRFSAALEAFVDNCQQIMELLCSYDLLDTLTQEIIEQFGKEHLKIYREVVHAGLEANIFVNIFVQNPLGDMYGYLTLSEIGELEYITANIGGQPVKVINISGVTIISNTSRNAGLNTFIGDNEFILYLEEIVPGSVTYRIFKNDMQALQDGRVLNMLRHESGYSQSGSIEAILLALAWQYHKEGDIINEMYECRKVHEIRHIVDHMVVVCEYGVYTEVAASLTALA
ncbi:MAG: hypothetical protein NTY47_06520, partial [Candidatus Omnitrophica bacterium]|nr:hypothetical protein [Candidatus Omnitrophota bacterium]